MIVDLTPPAAGVIVDGLESKFHDVAFSSESATITSQWENYTDPESGIRDHKVSVYRKRDGRLVNEIYNLCISNELRSNISPSFNF